MKWRHSIQGANSFMLQKCIEGALIEKMAAETVPPFFPVIIFRDPQTFGRAQTLFTCSIIQLSPIANPQTFSAVKTIFFMLIVLSPTRKRLVQ
jgi:hypothetical protein